MRQHILKFSWIILPLLLVALTTLTLLFDIGAGREAVQEFAREQDVLLHTAVYGITEAFNDLSNSISILAHPEVARGPAELRAAMAAVYEHSQLHGSKSFLHIAFYDEAGGAAIVYPPGSSAPSIPSDDRTPGAASSDGVSVSEPRLTDEGCIVTVSVPVRTGAVQGRIVGVGRAYLDLSRALWAGRDEGGYLCGVIPVGRAVGRASGVTYYVLDVSGAILQGPDVGAGLRPRPRAATEGRPYVPMARPVNAAVRNAAPAATIGDLVDARDPRSALFSIFVSNGYGGRFRLTLADTHREAVGVLCPFELGGNRLFLLSLRDSDEVIAPATNAQRRYWLAFGGFFLLLVVGGVVYWRRKLQRLKTDREEGDRERRRLHLAEAHELETVGLASIREISQALTRELELSQLLDLLCRKISEALGLAGLQVLVPVEEEGGVSYRLLASWFSDELQRALRRGVGRTSPKRGDVKHRGNSVSRAASHILFPLSPMQGVMADVVERMKATGRSLVVGDQTRERLAERPAENVPMDGDLKALWDSAIKSAKGVGLAELIACPLKVADHFEGVAVFLPVRGGISLELYETFAANLAQAIAGARNIEHQKRTLEELDQAYGRLRAFSRIGAEIVLQKNFYKIGQTIVDAITTHSTFSRAVLSLVEGDGMRRVAFSNLTREEIEDLLEKRPFSLQDLERIKANARKISRSYYLPAALVRGTIGEQGLTSTHAREEFIDWDPNDFFFVPLEGPAGMLGVISVDDPRDGLAPTEATIQPLESFAHLAAQAITTSKLRWELERSQNDYRNLFRDATDALFVLDEELAVVASNRQFSALAGGAQPPPGGDVVGMSFLDLVMPDWQAAVRRAFERVRSGLGRQELEFHLKSRTNTERIVSMSLEAKAFPRHITGAELGYTDLRDGSTGELERVMDPKTDLDLATDGGYIRYQGSLRDITASKEAERELLRRQEQLKIINTLGRLALSSFDLEPLFRETVEAIHQSLGYDNVALFVQDLEAEELVLEAQSGIFDVLVGRGYRVPAAEGVVGWTARSGVTRYVPDTSKDPHYIMPAGIFEIGAELSIPLLVEGEVKGVLDLETTQNDAFDPADISALETVADQLSQAIHNINLYQELRERALALALANEELLKVDKMKSDFVSMVSHELNTPVTVIKGYAQLMSGSVIGEINEKQQDILETIIEKSDHLSRLIIELLDLLKIETGQYTPELTTTNLTKMLEEFFVDQSKYLDTPRMSLVLELPKQPIILDVDVAKISAVFTHLLSNANKFTIGEGTVTVSAIESEDLYRFTVADTGIGIPEVEFERIFERLYQVDSTLTRHYGGTGLGLAVTRAIIERHHGRIWVESELGEGSRFIFTLPKRGSSGERLGERPLDYSGGSV